MSSPALGAVEPIRPEAGHSPVSLAQWARRAGWPAAIVIAVAVYAIGHPYLGIIGDATLYLGRSLADLDPAGVGRDIVFSFDGQSRFSVFSRFADPLVAAFGAERAGIVIAIAAFACVLAAILALARALGGDRRVIIATLLLAAVMPATYGAGIFRFAETAAVPRPFAEAAVILSIAALLAGRPIVAGLLLLGALAIHPIMAMAGVGIVLVLLIWRRDARWSGAVIAALVAATGLAAALGAAGVPLLDRMILRIDPEWLGMLVARSPYLFPTRWPQDVFAAPLIQATTIVVALRHVGPRSRRVLIAVVLSAFVQLAAAAVLGDWLHQLLVVQVQGWRALWLLAIVAILCLPRVAADLWREGAQSRVLLALIGLAWLCQLGPLGTFAICSIILALQGRPGMPAIRNGHAVWALAAVASIALVETAIATWHWWELVAAGSRDASAAFVLALRADLLVAPAWIAIAAWLLARPRYPHPAALGGAALVLATVALSTWDQRGSAAIWGNQDGFAATAYVPGAPSSEVMVVGGLSSSWFALGRPQYFSPEQAASIVFSRPLAMEWRRRAEALGALGLLPHNALRPWDPLGADDHIVVTAAKLAAFCARRDAPAAVIVPDRDDNPAPRLPEATAWKARAPLTILENFQPPQWHTIRGWIVTPCATPRAAAELAKSAVQ